MKDQEHLQNRGKVLVLGNNDSSLLPVIRSLGRGNVQVHVAWCSMASVSLHSKYIYAIHSLPPYKENCDKWLLSLTNLMESERFDLVLPCDDESIFPLQENKERLYPYGKIYLLEDNIFHLLFNKIKTDQWVKKLGIPMAEEIIIFNRNEVKDTMGKYHYPVIVKPSMSYNRENPASRHSVKWAYNRMELQEYINQILVYGPVIIQKFFKGVGVGVNLLMDQGVPLMVFQQQRVHEPLCGGGGSYRKSIHVNKELLDASLKILGPLQYTGVVMIEFKVNLHTGQWVFIEANARFWGSLPLALAVGVDFPINLYKMFTGEVIPAQESYRQGIYSRNLTSDIQWQRANLRADRTDPRLLTRPLYKVIGEAMINIITWRERIDTFAIDDIKPFLFEVRMVFRKGWVSIHEMISPNPLYAFFRCIKNLYKLQRNIHHTK